MISCFFNIICFIFNFIKQTEITMKKSFAIFGLMVTCIFLTNDMKSQTRLLRNPDICEQHIVFEYAGDIWICNTDGTEPMRLTTFQGRETGPFFSPDGRQICFTAEYDGNQDVYVTSPEGGNPLRLTWHPGTDLAKGWTPEGKVMFASDRTNVPLARPEQFWTVDPAGGFPERLIFPRVANGQFNADASRFAYQMNIPWESEFRHYRGGQNNPIWIMDMASHEIEKVPWAGSIDQKPVWIGEEVYFISDRDTVSNIWSYNVTSGQLDQRTFFMDFDTKNLQSGAGKLILENGGYIYTLDPGSDELEKVEITISGDLPWARSQWVDVSSHIHASFLSPTGKRALFSARGDIFTVPAEHGDIRNLTNSNGVADRDPAWSPDGKYISWFSDESGEYQLHYCDQYGKDLEKIPLRNVHMYESPAWSPDARYISFVDTDRNLWLLTLSSGSLTRVANEGFDHPERTIYPAWSPDSRWIAYVARLKSEYNAVFVYSLEEQKSFQVTDGMSNAISPAWDKEGKYLYFLSSNNYGLNVAWLDMTSVRRPLEYGVYMAVLSAEDPSPLAPKSDDEEIEKDEVDENKNDDTKKDKKGKQEGETGEDSLLVKIDFENLNQRILALDIPVRAYRVIESGTGGKIYIAEMDMQDNSGGAYLLHEYDLKERELKLVRKGIRGFTLSGDGKKILYRAGNSWHIEDAKPELKGEGILSLEGMRINIDPKLEWKQMFRESIRYQRDFLYVENTHGLDLEKIEETYAPWVEHVNHRADLTYILDIIGGEAAIGHSFTGGGVYPEVKRVPVGLLGADYVISDSLYRIEKIYRGENWNPGLKSPLSGPGINIREGEYLLAVNGHRLTTDVSIYSLFDQTAGKQTVLRVNNSPSMEGSREVTVVPVSSESSLRQREWMEANRKKVDSLSGGKLAYVWLPNTGGGGYENFNRYYFAQKYKSGAIIDERFNGGGLVADYIIDLLDRQLVGYFNNSVGDKQPFTSPGAALFGPKVMIVNESAGSGGDYLPYSFQKKKIGPLVGTRTWGGLVGWGGAPPLVDGGYMGAPRWGFFNTDGQWDVENIGVTPDVLVEQVPKLVIDGHDPQLEKGVEIALEMLKTDGVELKLQPRDPVRVLYKSGR
jgi:tricorn protease